MGRPDVSKIIKLLQEAGFRAGRAYPGTRMPRIQVPAVSVAIQKDEETRRIFAVVVFCPESMGGTACEDQAVMLTKVLREAGFSCTQEHCQYDGKGDRFSIRILAEWTAEEPICPFSAFINGENLPAVLSAVTQKKTEAVPIGEIGSDSPAYLHPFPGTWQVTLEELILPHQPESPAPEQTFDILIRRGMIGELFEGCFWTDCRRVNTRDGLHQIRVAAAGTRRIIKYGKT